MYSPAPRRGPTTGSEWLLSGLFMLIFLGLFAAEIGQEYAPAKLSVVLFFLFWMPLIALHETGHALAALVLDWHVGQLVVGMGACVSRFRIGSARIEIRLFPIEGFVKCVPTKLRWPQFESALIYLAGPGIELLLAAAIVWVIGSDRFFDLVDDYGLIAWQTLVVTASAQGIINLMPTGVRTPEGLIVSDGLGIIFSLLRPTADYEKMLGQRYDADEGVWPPDSAQD